jgi:4-hydroxy-2-oxoheptanedioate aldolase
VVTLEKKNWIKNQLKDGKTVSPLWAAVGSPTLAEAAVYAGWPVILIDNEHGTASLETTVQMVRAVESAGGHVIVRVPWNDHVYLKRILDLGVQSLMIPMISDKASAEEAVAACRYPPHGRRGYAAPIVRASGYGADQNYAKNAMDELLLIAQIEHIDAVENVLDIASVDGIDLLFIGPNDLAGSMNHFENMADSEVTEAFENIEKSVQASDKILGCFPIPGVSLAELRQRGHQFIAVQGDIGLFVRAASEAARERDVSLIE